MKVHAIRLAECGRFRTPVALENLSGSLDVVVGPNELGKSTLLRALRLALTEKHTSRNKVVEAMRPYSGGAPMIELEIEIDGARWRLRKRFLAQRAAELVRLDGNEIFRGEDAETRLLALLGGPSGGGRFPLLWLSQGEALNPVSIDKASRTHLDAAIQREVQSIATGDSTARLIESIGRRLSDFVTTHASPRPRGRYELALKRKRELSLAVETATARVAQAAEHLDRLEAMRQRESELAHPEASAALLRNITEARNALDSGRDAAGRAAEARQIVAATEQRLKTATRDLAEYERALASVASLATALASDEKQASTMAPEVDRLATEIEQARAGTSAREASLGELEERYARANAADRHRAVASNLARIERQLAEARTLTERRQAIVREIGSIRATENQVLAARREVNAIAVLDAQLASAATAIDVAYAPEAGSRIRIAGRALGDGERVETLEPLQLDIDGVGRVVVTPSRSNDHDELQADRDAHQGVLTDLLASCDASDLPALEAALTRRRSLETEAGQIGAQLSALAPSGIAALAVEHESIAKELAQGPRPASEASAEFASELEGAVRAARTTLQEWRAQTAALASRQSKLREDEAALRARIEERRRQLAAVEQTMPPEVERAQRKADLSAARDTAEAAMNEAVRAMQAWQEKAPDAARLAAMQTALASAEDAQARQSRELSRIAAEAARIEGELSVLRNEDAAAAAESLAGELADVADEISRIEDEIGALQLLDRELRAERDAANDQFLAPVNARLKPYLEFVLPDAALTFDADLSPRQLMRGALQEPLDRLSDGTREQIAVLTRLAFARLLADAGMPVPLILDDALVYADDERIVGLFDALGEAARAHQVLVLTCRSRAFEGLAGRRIALTPWSPA